MHSDSAVLPLSQQLFRLLVLDDSGLDTRWLQAMLQRDGLAAHTRQARTRTELLEALGDHDWDAVVAWLPLADIDAGDALEQVRARDPALPFLIIADALDEETAASALRNGANDYLARGHLARLAPAVLNAVSLARARRDREHAVLALRQSEQRLRELYVHVESVIEQERAAIAREIHDDIGNLLTTLRFDLAWIERKGDPACVARAGHALQTVAQVMESAQRIQRGLRPPVLDAGLVPALQWQIGEFRRATGIDVAFSHHGSELGLGNGHAMVLYRTMQESLTNVARHAQAHSVRIDLVIDANQASLEISDDGVGLPPQALNKPGSFGLRGLSERALQAGGWIDISNRTMLTGLDAKTDSGTCILLLLPLTAPMPDIAEPVT